MLIACPDCTRKISSKAPVCIGCGRSMNVSVGKSVSTQRRGGLYEAGGSLIILSGIGFMFATLPVLGLSTMVIGLFVFIAGRCM